ncbi:hypothetical protein ZIOFF_001971 [Zingiber officinale]|uniref:CCHC-type domain-containing protein n=1 Tax=Zingiber officinale TaxID=94328 RepID=A0A8J5M873_ZINOF|nr:hypothetical protein ZIOFF_001971 [Zingiber officinale]
MESEGPLGWNIRIPPPYDKEDFNFWRTRLETWFQMDWNQLEVLEDPFEAPMDKKGKRLRPRHWTEEQKEQAEVDKEIIAHHENPAQLQGAEEPKEKGSLVQEEMDQSNANTRSTFEEKKEEEEKEEDERSSTSSREEEMEASTSSIVEEVEILNELQTFETISGLVKNKVEANVVDKPNSSKGLKRKMAKSGKFGDKFKKTKDESKNNKPNYKKTEKKPKGKCFHCGVDGHWKRNYPKYLTKLEEKKKGMHHGSVVDRDAGNGVHAFGMHLPILFHKSREVLLRACRRKGLRTVKKMAFLLLVRSEMVTVWSSPSEPK